MDIKGLKEKLKDFFAKQNRTKLVVILGICGIVLIMLSELIPSDDINEKGTVISKDPVTEDTYEYKKQIETELAAILGEIKGVGEIEVMVTIEGTTEYVYAEELDTDTDKDGEKTSEQYKNQIVMTEENGKKDALVRKIIKPQISGVVIVCQGGGDASLNERVLKAASTALNLPSSKICVECRK